MTEYALQHPWLTFIIALAVCFAVPNTCLIRITTRGSK